jgi:uracil-DNA glycosylase
MSVSPRAHRKANLVKSKEGRLHDPHVAGLNAMVRDINRHRADDGAAPWFDPADGGTEADVLLLLECPGPRASAHKGSGFVSADNDDQTAANIFMLLHEAGLDRSRIVIWNVVPWYLPSADGRKTKNAKPADLVEAEPWLDKLVNLLPRLRLVVPMGAPALSGWMKYLTGSPQRLLLPTLAVPHPSPQRLNTDAAAHPRILNVFTRAAAWS